MQTNQAQGLVRVVSPEAVTAQINQSATPHAEKEPPLSGLAGYLFGLWEQAKQAKMPIETEMLQSLRQRRGEYDPEVAAEIKKFGGTDIYMMLTDVKCRAAEAWIKDVLMPSGDRPWTLDPTPIPDLSPDQMRVVESMAVSRAIAHGYNPDVVKPEMLEKIADAFRDKTKEEATRRAARMADKIEDQLVEGKWHEIFPQLISDAVTYKACIIKGPVFRRRKTLAWGRENGKYHPVVEEKVVMEFERRSPWNIYPSPHSTSIHDGYLFDRYEFTRADLESLIGVDGYNEHAIRQVLEQYGGGLRNWLWTDSERAALENRHYTLTAREGTIEALNFWGNVQGLQLLREGVDPALVPDPIKDYSVEVWLIGRYVIRADINSDPLDRKPYGKASFFNLPGSFWGNGVPEQMRDCARMCNVAARALANNVAIASGPMVEVHADRLADGENAKDMYPWRVYYTKSDQTGSGRAALNFFQPQMNAAELIEIYSQFERRADDVTGIPAYTYGNGNAGGAGSTASGLSMLFNAASKGIKGVIANLDLGIIEPMISRVYEYNMIYDPDDSIKGDLKVSPRGAAALIIKEQMQVRRAEFMQNTNNPIDAQIMGVRGRAFLLREAARSLDIPPDDIVPSDEELMQAQQAQQQPPQQPGAPQPGAPQQPGQPTTLNAAGEPAGGGDAALFTQRAQ